MRKYQIKIVVGNSIIQNYRTGANDLTADIVLNEIEQTIRNAKKQKCLVRIMGDVQSQGFNPNRVDTINIELVQATEDGNVIIDDETATAILEGELDPAEVMKAEGEKYAE